MKSLIIATLAILGGPFTLWPNNLNTPMTGKPSTAGTQTVNSDEVFSAIVESKDQDTYYNDVSEELQLIDSIAHDIVVLATRSGTQMGFTNNGVAGGVRTRTHVIKAIHVHAGQPSVYREDDYKSVDSANNPIDDNDVAFSHGVLITAAQACPPDEPGDN